MDERPGAEHRVIEPWAIPREERRYVPRPGDVGGESIEEPVLVGTDLDDRVAPEERDQRPRDDLTLPRMEGGPEV